MLDSGQLFFCGDLHNGQSDPLLYNVFLLADCLKEVYMALAATATVYTPEDLLHLPDQGRYELLDGHLVERKMGTQSSYAATNAPVLMEYFILKNNLGLTFQFDCGYQIFADAPERVRFAAGSFIRQGRLPEDQLPQGYCRTSPDLVIEAVSPHDMAYELEAKIAQWLGAGVRLVWVLYPEAQRIQVHRAAGTVTKLQRDEQLEGEEVLPGFRCRVTDVFRGL